MHRFFDNRSGALLLSLLASVFLHGFVFFLPFMGKAGGANLAADRGLAARSGLEVRLSRPADVVQRSEVSLDRPADVVQIAQVSEFSPTNDAPLSMSPAVEGVNIASSSPLEYYATSELTVKPKPVREISRDSWGLSSDAVPGRLELLLHINAQGDVVAVTVESGDMPDPFVSAAVQAFQQLQFIPGELHGRKVGAAMRIEVVYDEVSSSPPLLRSGKSSRTHRRR